MRTIVHIAASLLAASAAFAQSADVSVTLTLPATAVYNAGTEFTSAAGQVTVTNSGSVPAQNVTVDFDKALGIDYTMQGFTCALATDHYRCTAASMAPGSVTENVLAAWHNRQPAGTVEKTTVTVSSASPADPDTSNNTASANTTIVWSANLQLDSIDSFPAITPSGYAWMGVGVIDNGPSPASDFKLTFTIPPGATFAAVDSDLASTRPSCTTPAVGQSGDVVCTLQELSPHDGYVTIYVEVQVAPSTPPGTTLTFNGTLTSSDAVKSPQSATGTIHVVAPAELSVAMTSPSTVKQGDSYDNTVTVTNSGPGAALNASVRVAFSGAASAKAPAAPAGWTCNTSPQAATCGIDSMPPGTATFTFPGSVSLFSQVTSATQTAKVTSFNDVNGNNNQVSTTTAVQPAPQTDLGVSIAGTPAVVRTGDAETYTVQITNNSSNPALDVQMNAQLPGTMISNSCGASAPLCVFPTLAPGATATTTLVMRVDAINPGTLTATVTVAAQNVSGSRTASTTTSNLGAPVTDLYPTLTAPASVLAGGVNVWTIGIVNNGPDAPRDWTLRFDMAPGSFITGIVRSDSRFTCGFSGNSATCSGTILDGNVTALVTAQTFSSVTQPVHVTLRASTQDNDPHPENNVVSADSPIGPPAADLAVTMTTDTPATTPGGTAGFRISLVNIGNLAAPSPTVTIPLSPAFELVTPVPGCFGTTTVTCYFPTMQPLDTGQAFLTLRPTGAGTETATATAATTVSEARMDNNTASASVTVVEPGMRRRAARH